MDGGYFRVSGLFVRSVSRNGFYFRVYFRSFPRPVSRFSDPFTVKLQILPQTKGEEAGSLSRTDLGGISTVEVGFRFHFVSIKGVYFPTGLLKVLLQHSQLT